MNDGEKKRQGEIETGRRGDGEKEREGEKGVGSNEKVLQKVLPLKGKN